MGKSLTTKSGNDRIMTPSELGKQIVEYFQPSGRTLEPCCGDGQGFLQWLPNAEWDEIDKGRDFFRRTTRTDWIITNPPYSILTKFLHHCFELADHVALLILLPNVLQRAKIRLARQASFGLHTLIYVKNPSGWPQFGFQVGVAYWQRNYIGSITVVDWDVPLNETMPTTAIQGKLSI